MEKIDNWINFRHKPHSSRFQGTSQPKTFDLFDWVIWSPFDEHCTRTTVKNPKSILCLAHSKSTNYLLDELKFDSKPVLVIAGEDTNLTSYRNVFHRVSDRFSKIYFEAKDIEHSEVDSLSMGFNSYYLKKAKHENILEAIKLSDTQTKSEAVLAAWGEEWPHLDKTISDRKNANTFIKSQSLICKKNIQFANYWQELAKFHFLLAPRGQGIQSPKLAEAWMVKTIPIVTETPCFNDLKSQGFPLIIVDDWQDITSENITIWLKYYQTVNWENVRHMLTNNYLKDFLSK